MKTQEETLAEIKDRFRGGPRKKIQNFADSIGVGYEELLEHAKDYLDHDEYWNEGDRFESVDMPNEFWDWYELVTGTVVPPDKRWGFFSCSC